MIFYFIKRKSVGIIELNSDPIETEMIKSQIRSKLLGYFGLNDNSIPVVATPPSGRDSGIMLQSYNNIPICPDKIEIPYVSW